MDEICKHGHVLTPGRYVGAAAQEEDGELWIKDAEYIIGSMPDE
ncbi:hypothetical protein [uncultured Methanomethylovorans sp.]|nr:hypothetical protein [uncultured Methanomethylovorans sp.]